jgi:hypothetical protein
MKEPNTREPDHKDFTVLLDMVHEVGMAYVLGMLAGVCEHMADIACETSGEGSERERKYIEARRIVRRAGQKVKV